MIATVLISLGSTLHQARYVSYAGWIGVLSIIISVSIITIAVAIMKPENEPDNGNKVDLGITAGVKGDFKDCLSAISNIAFSFGGFPGFPTVISEMRKPDEFNKAMFISQIIIFVFYIIVAIVVYTYSGQYISTPVRFTIIIIDYLNNQKIKQVLGTAGEVIKKISFGIALPGLFIGGIVSNHIQSKSFFVKLLRSSEHIRSSTFIHWFIWLSIVLASAIASLLIALSIPFFDLLTSLIGSVFISFFAIVIGSYLWLYDNYNYKSKTLLYKFNFSINVFLLLFGIFLIVSGFYSNVVLIQNHYSNDKFDKPFSC